MKKEARLPLGERFRNGLSVARKNFDCYLFLLPFAVLFITFVVMPVCISIFYSFTDFNLLESPSFIGVENFRRLLVNDEVFTIAFRNTMIIAAIVGPVGYFASLMIAWQINELGRVARAVLVTVMYAPSISGGAYVIWQYMSDTRYMLTIVIVVMAWMSLGAGFLSFVAGLKTVDRSLYEAGYVEGINSRWQELWFITLPTMKPQLMFGAVMSITGAFSAGAVSTQMLGFPSTDYAAHTIINHLEDYGNSRFEMGYACAIATVLFVIMIAINEIVQRLLSKVGS